MKYKLIALDLDGTLKNSNNEITPKTKEALLRVQELGCHVVLASGRPIQGLRHDSALLELDKHNGFLLSYNGALVYNAQTKKQIYAELLKHEDAIKVLKKAKELKLASNTYSDDYLLTESSDAKYVKLEASLIDLPIKQVSSLENALPNKVYKVLLSEEPVFINEVVDEMVNSFPDLAIYRSSPWFIECMSLGIDKAKGLQHLCDYLNITQDEVMAFGDGFNDLSMLEFAGLGVAMGNAVNEVREKADVVTLSNNEDGIAYILKQYFPIDKA